MSRKYTNKELIEDLHRFVEEHGRVPKQRDMCIKNGYISYSSYIRHFKTFNTALKIAELPIKKQSHDEFTKCFICGTHKIMLQWYYDKDRNIICDKCYNENRNFLHGILDPNSKTGIGVITEHVAYIVLNDCDKCNTRDNFNAKYDLISKKYGIINVKSAILIYHPNIYRWLFNINKNSILSDCYICLGFDEYRNEIQHVWVIPGNSNLVGKFGITVYNTERGLKRFQQYEVDPTPYNIAYQNLDIYTLPEFRNLPRNTIDTTVPSELNAQEVS